jgi:hypothetical protein
VGATYRRKIIHAVNNAAATRAVDPDRGSCRGVGLIGHRVTVAFHNPHMSYQLIQFCFTANNNGTEVLDLSLK